MASILRRRFGPDKLVIIDPAEVGSTWLVYMSDCTDHNF